MIRLLPPAWLIAEGRVMAVGKEAWTLQLVREQGSIQADDLRISWRSGQVSPLETPDVTRGADVRWCSGAVNVTYVVTFALAFFAFEPDGVLHAETGTVRH